MATPGQFVWHELMTRNVEAAMKFYEAVVGWKYTDWEGDTDTPYVMMSRNGDPKSSLGGIMLMQEPEFPDKLPSHFMGYVSVDNADVTVERVKELGGSVVHGPADIPKVGRFAILEDPLGLVFAVLQSLNNEWEQKPAHIGEVAWCENASTDHLKAYDFYSKLFGWQIEREMDASKGLAYIVLTSPGSPSEGPSGFGGLYTAPEQMPGPKGWWYFFAVKDINAALQAVKDNGGTVFMGPMDVHTGERVAWAADAEGTAFGLTTMTGPKE